MFAAACPPPFPIDRLTPPPAGRRDATLRRLSSRWLLPLALLALAACGKAAEEKKSPPAPAQLVELATVVSGSLSYVAERAGSLRALREVVLRNEESGRIVELRVREGDRVAAGQVLVRYDESQLRAAHDKAAAALAQARQQHARSTQLVAQGFVSADAASRTQSAADIAAAEWRLLASRLATLTIKAPFSGVVAARHVEPGSVTPQHTELLTLIDPSQLITDVDVSELILPQLTVGDPAEVRIDALGTALHGGRIVRIHPAIDPATRSGRVEVALTPLPPGARPGQFCRVSLPTASRAQALVPLAAVQRDAAGEFVYVYQAAAESADAAGSPGANPANAGTNAKANAGAGAKADGGTGAKANGSVVRRAVQTGLRLADRVEIHRGLASGEQVVVKGFLGLAPGKKVRPVAAATNGATADGTTAGANVPAPGKAPGG